MSTCVVIGAGISGLATAALLAADGHEVCVVEGREETGGRVGAWSRDGFTFDTGPSWYLMPEVFDHFFAMLGTSAERELDLVPLTPAYRVYPEPHDDTTREGVDVVSGRAEVRALFDEREPGSGERIERYLDSAREAYELAVDRFLYDTYASTQGLRDRDILRRLPRLAGLLTGRLQKHIDRRFKDPLLRRILAYPAVFLGTSPYEAPSLYHLMSHLDLDEGVLYPRGGFREVIRAIETLARDRGVQIHTGDEVSEIILEGRRVTGVRTASGTVHRAETVVSTADLHHTETALLPRSAQSHPARSWRRRTPSPGAALVLLGVRGELPQLAHHTLLFADGWKENFDAIFGPDAHAPDPASIYVCRPSATDPNVAPPEHENLFLLVPVPADPSIGSGGIDGGGDTSLEEIADRAIAQVSEWAGIADLADRIVVRRTIGPGDFERDFHAWRGNALGLAHTLRQSAVFRPRNVSSTVDGLFYAGASVLPGIGLPMCLISAELVLKRLRGDLTAGPLAEPARETR